MRFRGDIEGLRAVAVLLVLASHLGLDGFFAGYIGVDVFFVISGYLITGLLLAEHESRLAAGFHGGGFSISAFYLRRLKRIFPAALLVLVSTVLASNHWWNFLRARRVQTDAWWAFVSAANWNEMRKATDYFEYGLPHSPLQHYWSLAVEEQFYFLWPFLLLAALKLPVRGLPDWRVRVVALLAAVWTGSLYFSILFSASNPSAAYFHPFARTYELATGALVAAAVYFVPVQRALGLPLVSSTLSASSLVGIVYCLTSFGQGVNLPGAWALVPVGSAAAVILSGVSESRWHTRILDNPPMKFVGRISYSLYLWHWPVILLLPAILVGLSDVTLIWAAIALSVTLAYLSYQFVEQPIRQLGKGKSSATLEGARMEVT